jgi:hypothetical protein
VKKSFLFLAAATLALAAVTPGHAAYAELFQDTLLPGLEYLVAKGPGGIPYPVSLKTAASNPGDTLELRGNGDRIPVEDVNYAWMVTLTYQAKAGDYDLYTIKGRLVEKKVTTVAAVGRQKPALARIIANQGLRGGRYLLTTSAVSGLPYGPLPAAGTFTSALKAAYLLLGSARIDLVPSQYGNAYRQDFSMQAPAQADTGWYALVLERADGVTTVLAQAFRIWVPPRPTVDKIEPDELALGIASTLTITGTGLEYGVLQGSYTVVDRAVVKDVFLRNGNVTLTAQEYPIAGGIWQPLRGISAKFLAPLGSPVGKYDLGIVINGRQDTTVVTDAVTVVTGPSPKLLSISPAITGRHPFQGVIDVQWAGIGFDKALYQLRKGSSVIPGLYAWEQEGKVMVDFKAGAATDTGAYDLEVTMLTGGSPLVLKGAVAISLSAIGQVSGRGMRAGENSSFDTEILYRDFDMDMLVDPATQASSTTRVLNVRRLSLCQGGDCLEAHADYAYASAFEAHVYVPATQTPGLYDLSLTTYDPNRTIEKKGAVLISPPGSLPLTPIIPKANFREGPDAYWSLFVDSLSTWAIETGALTCAAGDFFVEHPPAGLTYANGAFTWRPGASDTGYVYLTLASAGSCGEKRYMALKVSPKKGTAIRPRVIEAHGAGTGATVLAAGPASFRIRLAQASSLEVTTLDGRSVATYPSLAAGEHSLALPALGAARGLLLCRVRQGGRNGWLRLIR